MYKYVDTSLTSIKPVVGTANGKLSFNNRQSANKKVSFANAKLQEQLAKAKANRYFFI